MKIHFYTNSGELKSKGFEENTEYISLRGESITSIEFIQFSNFPFLKSIDLSSNNFEYLNPYDIEHSKKLERFDISFNRIKEVKLDSLRACERLESIGLTDNKLKLIDLSGLSGHPSLKTLYLTQNVLTELDLSELKDIPKLESLQFYNNQLESINLDPLSKFSNLMNLNLGNNSLRVIDLIPLRHVKSLRTLSLSLNKLESITLEPLTEIQSLEEIDLSSNQLRKIDLSPLANCRLLKKVTLGGNPFQEIDISPLFHCDNLKQLSVNEGVILLALAKYASIRSQPSWVRSVSKQIKFLDPSVEAPAYKSISTSQKEFFHYIELLDFDGLMFDLITEINKAFEAECYICTAFLSRKLLENLLISILQRKFGNTHRDYYLYETKKGEHRSRNFSKLLEIFWKEFSANFLQFSSTTSNKKIKQFKGDMEQLKDDFDVDVHHLGSFTDRDTLLEIRKKLTNLIKFLRHIERQII